MTPTPDDDREAAWNAIHYALPLGWHVGPCEYDPTRRRWRVVARPALHGRGRILESIDGEGIDEIRALWDLAKWLRLRGL